MIIEQLKKGELAVELINGELKLQFEEGLDLLTVAGKAVPYIALNIVNYTAAEGRME
jgi:malonyl CoA-acyl carrier protein transacylase